jgi:hypothetical protein
MTALVNIGLASRHGSIRPAHALAALRAIGGAQVIAARVHQSATEPTLVAEVRRPINAAAAYETARYLHQDAIAQFDGYDGQLYGPSAEAWGQFDPSQFLDLNGRRLQWERAAA